MKIELSAVCLVGWLCGGCTGDSGTASGGGESTGGAGTADADNDGDTAADDDPDEGSTAVGDTVGSDDGSDGANDSTGDGATDSGSDTTEGGVVPPDVAFGIMGDSNSDEYRADDDRGGAYADVTFNWMEQLVMFRGLDFGPWGRWGGSRRSGYEYNWARSGARTDDLVGQGQAAGVAQQVGDGLVDYVYIEIGANDFHQVNGTYLEIYDGSLSDAQVAAKVTQIVSDLTEAVDVVLDAQPTAVFLRTFGDAGLAPDTPLAFPDAAGRARVSAAIAEVNDGITTLAESRPSLVIIDTNLLGTELLEQVDENGMLMVGDELIDLIEAGNEPHHGRLGDTSGHAGTVISGIVANLMFIDPVNATEDLAIEPFSDDEILSHAGL